MSESLEDRLARIGAEAEAGEDDQADRPIPAHVKVSRPNRSRSKVLQVRLTPAEYDALEAVAAASELPVSTIARDQLLVLLAGDRSAAPATISSAADDLLRLATYVRNALSGETAAAYTIPPEQVAAKHRM